MFLSVSSSLDLFRRKIWIGKPFIDIFHFKIPRQGFPFLSPANFEIIYRADVPSRILVFPSIRLY